jgi:hypothetical protein
VANWAWIYEDCNSFHKTWWWLFVCYTSQIHLFRQHQGSRLTRLTGAAGVSTISARLPDRLGVRRLLITLHNNIGCTLEWAYIVIGCTSDSCDWLFCAVALAVVIATTRQQRAHVWARVGLCLVSVCVARLGICPVSSLTWFKVAKSGWKCAQSGNTDGLS